MSNVDTGLGNTDYDTTPVTNLKQLMTMLFGFGYSILCSLTPQKELGFKVQIFEKKVESYKKMTHKLNNTVEYIKVKLLTCLMVFILHLFMYKH